MNVFELTMLILGLVIVGLIAKWVIGTFLPTPARPITLLIFGVLLLLVLAGVLFPWLRTVRIG